VKSEECAPHFFMFGNEVWTPEKEVNFQVEINELRKWMGKTLLFFRGTSFESVIYFFMISYLD